MVTRIRTMIASTAVFAMVCVLFVSAASAQSLSGELGILDTSGTNPATGNPWAAGDAYHLTYVTTTTTDALSDDIADYNAFVQADALAEGMGSASWLVMGSTATTDAIDNAVITGPVINVFDNGAVATDEADFWDLDFSSSAHPTPLAGGNMNVHLGTVGGGTAHGGNELGAANGSVRIAWTGWSSWAAAWRAESTSDPKPLVAVSEELTVVPEPSTFALAALGLLGLVGITRRRR